MSLRDTINLAYNQALQGLVTLRQKQADQQESAKRIGNVARQGIAQALSQSPAQSFNYAASMFPQSTLTGVTSDATATTTPALTTTATPTVGPLATAAVPTAALPASNAAASAGTIATASGEASAGAGAGGATAGETAGSTLSSTGIGAIIGAGLAIGSSKPGDFLFPAKRFMYNTTLPVYNWTGGALADRVLGDFSPRHSLDWLFGDPNEQLRQQREAKARATALWSAQRVANTGKAFDAWNNADETRQEESDA